MAGPITWRSLAPTADPNVGAQLLQAAQRSFNTAFDPFQKAIQQEDAFAAQQAGQLREANKQAFLEALQGARSPEELAALQASGRLNELRARVTPENLSAIRGAEEARLAGLRQLELEAIKHPTALADARAVAERQPFVNSAALNRARISDSAATFDLGQLPTVQATTATDNLTKLGTAQANSTIQPLVDQERLSSALVATQIRPDVDTAIKQTAANNVQATRNTGTKLNEEARVFQENSDNRNYETRVTELAKQHRERMATGRANIEAEARNFPGVPVRQDGTVDYGLLATNPELEKRFNEHLKSKNYLTTTDVTTGDTKALSEAEQLLLGRVSPAASKQILANTGSLFNTARPTPVGNDAETLTGNSKVQEALSKEHAFKYGQVATPENVQELLKVAIPAIKDITEEGSSKRETYIERITEMLKNGGIKKGDLRVLPSPAQLELMIRGTKQKWNRSAWEEIARSINEWEGSSEAIKGAEEAINQHNRRLLQAAAR